LPPLARIAFDALVGWFEPRYRRAIDAIDHIVANSEHVATRVSSFLGRQADVVYPPCDVERFRWRSDQGFFLSNARLDPLKRVDRIIDAFLKMPAQTLVVASSGPAAAALKVRAAGAANIRFVGRIDDATMANLIGDCRALIYLPIDEDFGISPIEALAAGKPVIGVRAGGLIESLADLEGATLLSPDAPIEALIDAVDAASATYAQRVRSGCEQRAQRFTRERFLAELRAVISRQTRAR
jgi:glycosyltransferase involved in cell wall biosynthesis